MSGRGPRPPLCLPRASYQRVVGPPSRCARCDGPARERGASGRSARARRGRGGAPRRGEGSGGEGWPLRRAPRVTEELENLVGAATANQRAAPRRRGGVGRTPAPPATRPLWLRPPRRASRCKRWRNRVGGSAGASCASGARGREREGRERRHKPHGPPNRLL